MRYLDSLINVLIGVGFILFIGWVIGLGIGFIKIGIQMVAQ